MDAGGFDSQDYPVGIQYYRVAVVGTGATPPVRASNGLIPPLFPVKANVLSTVAAEAPARTGAGVYTLTVSARFKTVAWLDVAVDVSGTGGMWAQVSAFNPTTRQLTLRTFASGGAATDLAATDLAVLTFTAVDSSTIL